MGNEEHPPRWVSEDEMLLADLEGVDAARATVAYARERRRRTALQRWGQLQRIADVFGLGELDAYNDVRLRVLRSVIGYVDEHVWRDAIADVRRQVLETTDGQGWFPDLAVRRTMRERYVLDVQEYGEQARAVTVDEEALFLPDPHAVSGMSVDRKTAVARAQAHLTAEGSTMVVQEDDVFPNPYQDLWIVGYADPEHPDEVLDGGGPIIVPAHGEVYELGSLPPRPAELIGAILPPDEEWD
ncbi:hypothetical protein ACI3ET_01230 [Ornithinimicrobium sp. LYQ121]|uniref:hypothetical protein n=1 Tax=Ornithinimicrobium sp. LYQ121 TaxID=3378801 RepID=UPI003853DADB